MGCTVGIRDEVIGNMPTLASLRDGPYWQGSAEAKRVPGARSKLSMEFDTTYRSAERWLWDISPAFPDGFDGFIYYIIFVCRVSLFIRIYPVRDKSAQTFITCALERLRVFVQTTHPDTHLLSIHGDSDAAVSQWGHGEDQDTRAIKAYNENLAHPILITRSPANVHQMNALEPQQKRVNYLANHAGMMWTLGRRFAIDLVVSAAEQLNDGVVPHSVVKSVRTQTRYQVFMRGRECSDISRWVASPGQSVWVHIAGSKANMGEVKAKAAIFCYPLRGARGFVVRLLESRKLMVVYSISVVDDHLVRHARTLANDDMRNTYGQSLYASTETWRPRCAPGG
jgi:hypothetical protein